MDECLNWFAVLAASIVAYESQPGLDIQHSLGSVVPDEQQQKCREALQRAVDALRSGEALVEQRDHKKRKYDDTHPAEQIAIENYETGRAQRITKPAGRPHHQTVEEISPHIVSSSTQRQRGNW
jgi:hypothetical protein